MLRVQQVGTYEVWDVPTRLFHWINAITICGSLLTGMAFVYVLIEGTPKIIAERFRATHLVLGYLFLVNLLVRFIWGFIGNRFARWRSVLPDASSLAAIPSEIRGIVHRHPHEYLGRSPLSRISNTTMFLLFGVQAVSGVAREWTPFYYPFATIHVYNAYALAAIVCVHVAGVTLSELRQRSGIVSSMFSGTKIMATTPIDLDDTRSEPSTGSRYQQTAIRGGGFTRR